MSKICINGLVREMTQEEIAEMELAAHEPEETIEEKLAKIEQLYNEIKLMSGVKD